MNFRKDIQENFCWVQERILGNFHLLYCFQKQWNTFKVSASLDISQILKYWKARLGATKVLKCLWFKWGLVNQILQASGQPCPAPFHKKFVAEQRLDIKFLKF